MLFGADGKFPTLRKNYLALEGMVGDIKYMEYGYKELSILPGENGKWLMEKNALHSDGTRLIYAYSNAKYR